MTPDFDEYVAARSAALLRFAHVLTGDVHLAEDLLQVALVKTYRHWSKISRLDHPDAYVRRVLVTSHISSTRRRRVREQLLAVLPDHGHGAPSAAGGDPAQQVAERDLLHRALVQLSARQRAVLVLRHYAGYDDPAIADTLGCTEGTVRVNASRGAARLRAVLQQEPSTTNPRTRP